MNSFDQLNAMLERIGPWNVVKIFGNYTDPNHLVFLLKDGSSESITLLGRHITASSLQEYFQRRCPEAELSFYAYNFLGGNKQPHLKLVQSRPKVLENITAYPRYSELVDAIGGW